MAIRDFRDFVAVSEQQGLLRRVRQRVDASWEPACMAKWAFQALPEEARFGLLFEDVEGSEFQLATGVIGASTRTYALALGVAPEEINDKWIAALMNPVKPSTVERAPCQEVVLIGEEADLTKLPIPTWTPGKDAAPYITTITVTRRADDGVQNMGVYRTMVRGPRDVVSNLNPGRHGFMQASTWLDQGKPAPIAWVIGTEPAVHLATVANMPFGADEVEIAGGLKGEPVELVKCQTSDIMVPANSEIIIEGEVLPGERATEGPFGEMAGYVGAVGEKPVVRITAITHRKDAIYYGLTSQMPPSESTVLQSLTQAAITFKTIRYDLGESAVSDVYVDRHFGGILAHGIVAMTPRHPGHAKKVGRLIANFSPLKRITVVDDDIDIRDPLHVDWAMNARYMPHRDTEIIDDVYIRSNMDPALGSGDSRLPFGSKLVIDATQSVPEGTFSLPSKDLMDKALESWKAADLPEFEIPKRATLRFDRS
jgi:UbiD family decarboxylase